MPAAHTASAIASSHNPRRLHRLDLRARYRFGLSTSLPSHLCAGSYRLHIGMLVAVDEQGRAYTPDGVAEGGKVVVNPIELVMQPARRVA